MENKNLDKYIAALKRLQTGKYDLNLPKSKSDELNRLGEQIKAVNKSFHNRLERSNRLFKITEQINEGVDLNDVWNHVYDSFHEIIPYDRIGVARLIDDNQTVYSCWHKSDSE